MRLRAERRWTLRYAALSRLALRCAALSRLALRCAALRRALSLGFALLLAGTAGAQAAPGAPTPTAQTPAPASTPVPLSPTPSAEGLTGGVPTGQVSTQQLPLTLDEAIARGLRANLSVLLSASQTQQARANRYLALSGLLPQVQASASQTEEKVNLAAFGISIPGVNPIVGPFRVFDARGFLHQPVLNLSSIEDLRSSRASESAARFNYQQARDLVVLAVANQYLLGVADAARVDAVQAQLATAEQSLKQAQDMHQAGLVNALDVVRAEVERDRQRQQLIAANDELAKQKLRLARAIGLPQAQDYRLADTIPYTPLPPTSLQSAINAALSTRADYKAAHELVRAAQLQVQAARAQHVPELAFDANYGTIGQSINSNHPTFLVEGSVQLPVFTGGRIRAQVLQAEARLQDARNREADLRAGVEQDVRNALLDVQASSDQVAVAQRARDLAQQELTLARDRFRAGVAGNLEEVQAQQEVAVADENYISSLYAFNAAKAALARALGVAESAYRLYLEGVH